MLRKCINCFQYKDESEFPKRTGGGYQSYCKPCKRLLDRQHKKSLRELRKEINNENTCNRC